MFSLRHRLSHSSDACILLLSSLASGAGALHSVGPWEALPRGRQAHPIAAGLGATAHVPALQM